MKHLLAIDPGSIKLGYAVFTFSQNSLVPIELGTKYLTNVLPNGEKVTMYVRLERARQFIEDLCEKYSFDESAIEEAFTGDNIQSGLKLAVARGVIMSALLKKGVPISEYPAKTIKAQAAGGGKADKQDIIRIMQLEFAKTGLVDELKEDAADALAIGKAHHQINHSSIMARVRSKETPEKTNQGAFRKKGSSNRSRRKMDRSAMEAHLINRQLLR